MEILFHSLVSIAFLFVIILNMDINLNDSIERVVRTFTPCDDDSCDRMRTTKLLISIDKKARYLCCLAHL